MGGGYRPAWSDAPPAGSGAEHHPYAFFWRKNTDGGGRWNRHQPGAGQPPGKERTEKYEELPGKLTLENGHWKTGIGKVQEGYGREEHDF